MVVFFVCCVCLGAVAVVLTALATVGAIVYGSMINLQNNFGKYEVSIDTSVTRCPMNRHGKKRGDRLPSRGVDQG